MSDQTPNDQQQPDATDAFAYDVYISYSDADQRWVHDTLLPRLEIAGVRACIGERDFYLGVPRMAEQERAILTSRKTLVVLSPSFLASGWTTFDRLLQQTLDAESREYRLIPLLKEPCELPPSLRYLTPANFIDPSDPIAEWARLIETLRSFLPMQPPPAIPVVSIPNPAPLSSGSRMLLSPNPLFVGREDELRALARVLKARETAAIGQVEIAATTGLGGIGKTQLAAEFAHRYGQFFAGGVYWLSFADPSATPTEVAACGGASGMRLSPDFYQYPLEQQVQLVRAAWESPIPRLLIFDNCEDETLLDQWRPKHGGCRVLVTSRRAEWDSALGVHPLALNVLPRTESIALLRAFRPDLAEDDRDLDAIAAELGDLPLALHLAGSFLKRYQQDITAAEYLDELRAATGITHESLAGAGISPTKHDLSVARTFQLSYDRLDVAVHGDALALAILARTAYFAPGEPIPRNLLQATLELVADERQAKRQATQGVRRLVDLGLLEEEAEGSVRVHRLVSAFVRALVPDMTVQVSVEQTMLGVTRALNATDYPGPLLVLQPHLRVITNAALKRQDERAVLLGTELASHLYMIGMYAESQGYYEQVLTINQQMMGTDHLKIAMSRNNLGMVLQAQGQYAEAQNCFEQALAILQQELGLDHPHTATNLNNLGLVLQVQGQYAKAQDYLQQVLVIFQRVLGNDHPDTARSFNNLGTALQAQGQYAEAQNCFEQALAIRQRVLGVDHPHIAISLNNLGLVLQMQGQYADAQNCFEQALVIFQRVLGNDHPDTARSFNNLGLVFLAQKQYAEAQGYFEQVLVVWQQVLGGDHPDTAGALNNLGTALQEQGRYVEAQNCFEQALAIRQRVLGMDHPYTASSLESLGMVLQEQGQYAEAQNCFEQALAIFQRVLGNNHPDTASGLNNLGSALREQEQYAEAQNCFEQALAIFQRVNHPNTYIVQRNLASLVDQQHEP